MGLKCFICVLFFCSTTCSAQNAPKMLLVAMDGFGHKYLDTLPNSLIDNFTYFVQNGVKAKWMENVYPSLTFPNFYSMITGLYPESHGLVHNVMFDFKLNDSFSLYSLEDNFDPKWYGAETIYCTNDKAGSGRHSGSIAFPTGLTPSKNVTLDHVIPNLYWINVTNLRHSQYTIDTMIDWFQDKDKPINLGLLYFAEPDEVSHHYGPDSNEAHAMIGKVNEAVGYLTTKLRETGLLDNMNIIFTADHGQVTYKGFVDITNCSDRTSYATNIRDTGVTVLVWPKQGHEDVVYESMRNCSPHLHVYKKGGPKLTELHYSNNDRIAPLVLEPDVGYLIGYNESDAYPGLHGYIPSKDTDLFPFFIASGPAFKKGIVSGPIHILDLYPLMCEVLGIKPSPNNGSFDRVRHLLVDQPTNIARQLATSLLVVTPFWIVTVVCDYITGL